MELSLEDIKRTEASTKEGEHLNDTCIQVSFTALDTAKAQEKFLIVNEVSRQLPFNKKTEDINIERLTLSLLSQGSGHSRR